MLPTLQGIVFGRPACIQKLHAVRGSQLSSWKGGVVMTQHPISLFAGGGMCWLYSLGVHLIETMNAHVAMTIAMGYVQDGECGKEIMQCSEYANQ